MGGGPDETASSPLSTGLKSHLPGEAGTGPFHTCRISATKGQEVSAPDYLARYSMF